MQAISHMNAARLCFQTLFVFVFLENLFIIAHVYHYSVGYTTAADLEEKEGYH